MGHTTEDVPAGASSARRLNLTQQLGLIIGVPALIVLAAVIVGIFTITHQNRVRNLLLVRITPANAAALRLQIALLNQETGIRGYELSGDPTFLAPYREGVTQAKEYTDNLRGYAVPGAGADLKAALARIATWERDTATPASREPAGRAQARTLDASLASKRQFDAIRSSLDKLQALLLAKVLSTKAQLASAANTTTILFVVIGVALVLSILSGAVLLRRFIIAPIDALAAGARRVAGGDLDYALALSGPRDLEDLAGDVDGMRRRLLDELTVSQTMQHQLAVAAEDLQRSNTELEQFAYVASHDLQEPLRKVTSFCQLLADRYAGKLDDRADQYIGFAVDGAKRMQQLINDLLAFSRVGRTDQAFSEVALNDLADTAVADLSGPIEDSDATIEIGPLPTLSVEPALMRTVLQNLLGNAIKFRAEAPPHVTLEAAREGESWLFRVSDNGIGIEPEYAERIFVIFQRLHTRETYAGTGIGLAMCRKIVEHHGGRMWLDEDYRDGTRMCFTLPAGSPAELTTTTGSAAA